MAEKELSKQGFAKYLAVKAGRLALRTAIKVVPLQKVEFDKKSVKRILFIQMYGIGDYLMSSPAIRAIAKEFPKAEKVLLCKEHSKELAELNNSIDKVITSVENAGKIDLCISMNDSAQGTMLANKVKAKYVIGFLKGKNVSANFEIKEASANEQTPWVEKYLLIADAMGINLKDKNYELTPKKTQSVERLLKKCGAKKFIVVNPNSREGAEAKNWGNENYAKISDAFANREYKIIFCGGKGEKDSSLVVKLMENKSAVLDLTGKLSLKEVAYLFSKAKLFVGNDTGLMHIALGVKRPTIGLFGPTNSELLFPKGNKKYFAFQVKNSKWPCYTTGTFDIRANQDYMNTISTKEVLEHALEMIK